MPVAFSLGIIGFSALYFISGSQAFVALPAIFYDSLESFTLIAIPIYIFMANLITQSKVSQDLYEMLQDWMGHFPGGLGITTVLFCAGFSAISGSSVATAATVGMLALPEMIKAGYERRFVFGLIAAGGTMGILIPPSLFFILYGALTDVSVGKLFIAGIIPGLIMSALFLIYVIIFSKIRGYGRRERSSWEKRWTSTKKGFWILLLPVIIIGGIYIGIFTPTEAAAVGTVYVMLATFIRRSLSFQILRESLLQTLKTTSMIFLIICGALLFGHVTTILKMPQQMIYFISKMGVSPIVFVIFVCIIFIFLGDFLEVVSITVITLPLLHPILMNLNIDLLWFGVVMCINMEFALITPPVGLNLYVIQGIVPDAHLIEVFLGTWPFMILMTVTLALIFIFPFLVTWLPQFLS
jgi:C4-dicarboxylate transporter DctM subunit